MFTGIIISIGTITSVQFLHNTTGTIVQLNIDAGALTLEDINIGDSIALNGACMTIINKTSQNFTVDVSHVSLELTTGLNTPGKVNIEKALSVVSRLNGHLLSGHIDGLGIVRKLKSIGKCLKLTIEAPQSLSKYLAYKGSIAINGVSLTVNNIEDIVTGCLFSINLIPHTIQTTTLKYLKINSNVNLEIDIISRYVERMLSLKDLI